MDWKKFRDLDAVSVDSDGLYYDGGFFERADLFWGDVDSVLYKAIQSEDVDIWHDDTPAVQELFGLLFEKVEEDIFSYLCHDDALLVLEAASGGAMVDSGLLNKVLEMTGLAVEALIAITSAYYSSFEDCLEALRRGDAYVKVGRPEDIIRVDYREHYPEELEALPQPVYDSIDWAEVVECDRTGGQIEVYSWGLLFI